jgi:hypothetical protein
MAPPQQKYVLIVVLGAEIRDYSAETLPSGIHEGHLKSSWTGGSAPLFCCYVSLYITVAHCASPRTFQTALVDDSLQDSPLNAVGTV